MRSSLASVATYRRTVAASLERVVENVLDWEHLPWLHRASFSSVELVDAGESGWRDGYRYTVENIDLIRRLTGQPGAAVHPVGGIGNDVTPGEVDAMVAAARDRGAIGGSIYDYLTTYDALWPSLQGFLAF